MDQDEVLTAVKHLKLSDRLVHTHWKVREEAYQQVGKLINGPRDSAERVHEDHAPLLGAMLRDGNAAAQLAGLDTAKLFAEKAPVELCRRQGEDIGKALTEKVLTGRPVNRQRGTEVYFAFVSAEAGVEATEVLCSAGFSHKTIKVAVASATAVTEALESFGTSVIPIGPIKNNLPKLLEHNHADARNAAKALAAELHRWVGEEIQPALANIKSVTMKDLEAAFRKNRADGAPKPTKFTRNSMPLSSMDPAEELDKSATGSTAGCEQTATEKEIDVRPVLDFHTEITKMSVTVGEDVYRWSSAAVSPKWDVRKEAFDSAVRVLDGKKVSGDCDLSVAVSPLRTSLAKDVNLNVVSSAAHGVKALAHAQRNEMKDTVAAGFCASLLPRLKEKNPSTKLAVFEAMVALVDSKALDLTLVMEEIHTASKSKIPVLRVQLFLWLLHAARTSSARTLFQPVVKDIAAIAVRCLEDASGDVRTSSFRFLAALTTCVGSGEMSGSTSSLSKLKQDRLAEFIAEYRRGGQEYASAAAAGESRDEENSRGLRSERKEELQSGGRRRKSGVRPPLAEGDPPEVLVEKKRTSLTGREGERERAALPSVKTKADSPLSTPAPPPQGTPARASLSQPFLQEGEPVVEGEADEAALCAALDQLCGANAVLEELVGRSAKGRTSAAEALSHSVQNRPLHALQVRALLWAQAQGNGLRDTHTGAFLAKLELLGLTLRHSPAPFPGGLLETAVDAVVSRLGDLKCSKQAHGTLLAVVAAETSAEYVAQACARQASRKLECGPRVLAGACALVSSLVIEFGARHVPQECATFLACEALSAGAPALRAAGASLAATVEVCYESRVLRERFAADEKVHGAIDKGMERATSIRETMSVPPARKSRCWGGQGVITPPTAAVRTPSARRQVVAARSAEKTLFGRSSPARRGEVGLLAEIQRGLQSDDWGTRAKAVESLQQEPLEKLEGSDVEMEQIFTELRRRISDSNRNIAAASLLAMGRLLAKDATAATTCAASVVPHVVRSLGDVKKAVREGACACLDRWLGVVAPVVVLRCIPPMVRSDKSPVRRETLRWLTSSLRLMEQVSSEELQLIVANALVCASDKVQEVRQIADQLLRDTRAKYGADRVAATSLPLSVEAGESNQGDAASKTTTPRATPKHAGAGVENQESRSSSSSSGACSAANDPSQRLRRSALRKQIDGRRTPAKQLPSSTAGNAAEEVPSMSPTQQQVFQLSAEQVAPETVLEAVRTAAAIRTPMRSQYLTEFAAEATPAVHKRWPGRGSSSSSSSGAGARDESGNINRLRNMLISAEADERIQGVKLLHQMLAKMDPLAQLQNMALVSSEIVSALAHGTQSAFATARNGYPREVKYCLNGLLQVFARKPLASSIDRPALTLVVSCALERMVDPHTARIEDGPNLVKLLHVLMMRVLDNSPRAELYHVLVGWLGNETSRCEQGEAPDPLRTRRTELAIKCVLKLSKNGFEERDLPSVLRDIYVFMALHSRSRLAANLGPEAQLSMRCVKSMLADIVGSYRQEIFKFLTQVPVEKNPVILRYIHALLKAKRPEEAKAATKGADAGDDNSSKKTSAVDTAGSKPPEEAKAGGVTDVVTSDGQAEAVHLNRQLAAIFGRIGSRVDSRKGIQELHEFMESHPEVDVQPRLKNSSPLFQKFIARSLEEIGASSASDTGAEQAPKRTTAPAPSTTTDGNSSKVDEEEEQDRGASSAEVARAATSPVHSTKRQQSPAESTPATTIAAVGSPAAPSEARVDDCGDLKRTSGLKRASIVVPGGNDEGRTTDGKENDAPDTVPAVNGFTKGPRSITSSSSSTPASPPPAPRPMPSAATLRQRLAKLEAARASVKPSLQPTK